MNSAAVPNPLQGRPAASRSPALALAGLALATLSATLNTSIVNVALPTLTAAFGASAQAAQWTVTAFVLAITALIVGAGRLADIVGRRRLLLAGIAVFTGAAAACALAPGLGWLIAFRFLQGAGAAVMLALGAALVGDLAPRERAGRVMGLLGGMSALGTALGPALGGLLIAGCGWTGIFWISVPVGLATFALVFRHVPDDRPQAAEAPRSFDAVGTLLLALALAAYALGLTRSTEAFGVRNALLLALAGAALVLFVRRQRSHAAPLLRLELLESDALRGGLLLSALVGAVMMSTLVVGPFHLSRALLVEPGRMGLLLSVGPLVAAAVAVPAGRLVDRVGGPVTAVLGLSVAGAGALALALLAGRSGVPGFLVPVAVLTAGYAVFQTANNTEVMADAGADRRGLVAGLLNLARNLGLVTGVSLLGGLFAWRMGTADSPDPGTVAAATRTTFAAATGILVVALALAVRRLRRRATPGATSDARRAVLQSSPASGGCSPQVSPRRPAPLRTTHSIVP